MCKSIMHNQAKCFWYMNNVSELLKRLEFKVNTEPYLVVRYWQAVSDHLRDNKCNAHHHQKFSVDKA